MAEQGTEEKSSTNSDEAGRHAAPEESGSGEQQAQAEQKSDSSSDQTSDSSSDQKQDTSSGQKQDSSGRSSDSSSGRQSDSSSEQKTQEHANGQARSERSAEDSESGGRRGQADTSWAEDEPSGSSRHRSVDVGELAWRTGNVLATVVRTLALLFALVLIVNVVLVLVGVNPTNGVAQFVGTVASVVILGFRDLFVPANPTVMLIVNSLIAAVFWAFVGELLSRLIRFLAARVK
jgi:hypothetical protein